MRLFWQQPGVLFFTFWESGKEKPFTDLLIAAYPWVEFAYFFFPKPVSIIKRFFKDEILFI